VNKKPQLLTFIVFAILVIAVFIGIYFSNVNKSLTNTAQCSLHNNTCLFSNETLDLTVVFKQTPIVEEEIFIDFTLSRDFIVKQAWIEGINMYMGKTPIMINKRTNGQVITGVTFLGSCSNPTMQWQLFVEVENKTSKQTYIYTALFSTKTV
jgi:hypothetical protein